MQDTQVQSLGREGPLEEVVAIPSSILAWRIPWTKESGRLQSTGLQRIRLKQLSVHARGKMPAHQCHFHPDDLKYLLLIEGATSIWAIKLGQYITTYEHLSMHFFGNLVLYMSTFYS